MIIRDTEEHGAGSDACDTTIKGDAIEIYDHDGNSLFHVSLLSDKSLLVMSGGCRRVMAGGVGTPLFMKNSLSVALKHDGVVSIAREQVCYDTSRKHPDVIGHALPDGRAWAGVMGLELIPGTRPLMIDEMPRAGDVRGVMTIPGHPFWSASIPEDINLPAQYYPNIFYCTYRPVDMAVFYKEDENE